VCWTSQCVDASIPKQLTSLELIRVATKAATRSIEKATLAAAAEKELVDILISIV
jgi:hypothetical protein